MNRTLNQDEAKFNKTNKTNNENSSRCLQCASAWAPWTDHRLELVPPQDEDQPPGQVTTGFESGHVCHVKLAQSVQERQ